MLSCRTFLVIFGITNLVSYNICTTGINEVNALVDEYGKSVSIRENMFTDLQVIYRKAADAVKKCTDEIKDMKRKARITEYFIE